MRGLLIKLVGLAVFGGFGASAEPLPVRLKDGANWTLTVVHERETERGGARQTASLTSTSRLVWKDGKGGPDTLTITPVSVSPGQGVAAGAESLARFQIPLVLEVDADLSPIRVVNMTELRASLDKMMQQVNPEAAAGMSGLLKSLSDDSLMAMATQDLGRLALVQNSDMPLGDEQVYDDELPNPLGGSPIAAKGAVRLESFEPTSRRAVVTWRQAFDPTSAARSVAEAAPKLAAALSPERKTDLQTFMNGVSLERDDRCRYEIDTVSGLVARAECSSVIVAGVPGDAARRTDRWTYSQSAPESR